MNPYFKQAFLRLHNSQKTNKQLSAHDCFPAESTGRKNRKKNKKKVTQPDVNHSC